MGRIPAKEEEFERLLNNLKSSSGSISSAASFLLTDTSEENLELSEAVNYRIGTMLKGKVCCKCGKPAKRMAINREKRKVKDYFCHPCFEDKSKRPPRSPKVYSTRVYLNEEDINE